MPTCCSSRARSGTRWSTTCPSGPSTRSGVAKRERQLDRSLRYIDELGARFVFPTAGPPCFLDPELFDLNDIHGDESNIFPDQQVYLDWLAERGPRRGAAAAAGIGGRPDVGRRSTHPVDPADDLRRQAGLPARLPGPAAAGDRGRARVLGPPEIDVAAELKEWIEPLLAEADYMAAGIDGGVRLIGEDAERGDVDLIIDFVAREVRPYAGEKVRYQWRTARALLEQQVIDHEVDWSNSLFLSCRFTATRIGPYNEFVYTFFKCLSEERLNYVEGWYVESDATTASETTVLDGWEVQRRCPHLKADLSRFGAGRGRGADLPDARVEVAPVRRQVPHQRRPRHPQHPAGRRRLITPRSAALRGDLAQHLRASLPVLTRSAVPGRRSSAPAAAAPRHRR